MRTRVLAASLSIALIICGRVAVQGAQDRLPDHEHQPVGLPGVRQLAVKPFTQLPKGILFLRFETFSTIQAAEHEGTPASAVVTWAGKIWLLTLGPKGVRSSPEVFYLLTGEQCLETLTGTTRARAGEGMVAPANTPMQLNITGPSRRDAFFVVIHDAAKPRVTPSDWQPTGSCNH